MLATLRTGALRFGDATAEALSELAIRHAWRRAWVVGDRHVALRLPEYAPKGVQVWYAPPIAAHCPLDDVLAAIPPATVDAPDAIIAVGGGGVIDAAKVLLAAASTGMRPKSESELDALGDALADLPARPRPAFVAVPTTLATAAFTPNAGVAVGDGKRVLRAPLLQADVVIGDGVLLLAGTPAILATAFGPLNHCVEGAHALRQGDAARRGLLEAAAAALVELLDRASGAATDAAAMQSMLSASWLASLGVQGVRLGAGHAVPHVLGAMLRIPHAQLSAIMVLDRLRRDGDPRAEIVRSIMRRLRLSPDLAALGLAPAVLERLAPALSRHALFAADVQSGGERSAADCLARIGGF